MNMSGAQKNVGKLLHFVQSVGASETALYDKSKRHLSEIAEVCNQIESMIAEILQTAKPRGFEPNVEIKNDQKIQKIEKRVDKIEEDVYSDPNNSQNSREIPQSKNNPPTIESSESSHDISEKMKSGSSDDMSSVQVGSPDKVIPKSGKKNTRERLTPNEGRLVTHLYAKTLQKAANSDCGNDTVKLCYDLIWRWFSKRVLYKPKKMKKVYFDVRDLKNYIYCIVICFGYHMEQNDLDKFIQKFDEWMDQIGVSEEITKKYMVPYDIYEIYNWEHRKEHPEYGNLTATVLWDVLWDNGYSELSHISSVPSAELSNCMPYEVVLQINPDVLEDYVLYSEDLDILNRLNLA